ncbi:MAG: GNAT family N-acetyltransferase [Actinomycetota bacterium]
MTFPEPFRARPARHEDLDALVELLEARDLVDVGFVDQARDEILQDWAGSFVELERDTVVAEAADGSIAAYGVVLAFDPAVQVAAMGRVHPIHAGRGLGSAILAEQERRAAERLATGITSPFRSSTPSTDEAARRLFTHRGYRHVRSSWLMQRSLPADDLERPDPDGIDFRSGRAGDEPLVHAVLMEAFRQHFGYEPVPFGEWRRWMHEAPGYDPGLAVLAFADGVLAGVSVNFTADDGAGWVGDLGVLPRFRRTGIASALLVRSFAALTASGHHEVRLGVDIENESGATHLYEGAGMRVRRRFDTYEKRLTGA